VETPLDLCLIKILKIMLTVVGILMMLFALVMLILYPMLRTENIVSTKTDRLGNEKRVITSRKAHPILLLFKRKLSLLILFGGFLVALLPSLFWIAEPGVLYAVQYPWGDDGLVSDQGIHTKVPFTKFIDIQMEIPIKDVLPESEKIEQSEFAYILQAKEREFNDAVKGTVANSIVITIDYSNEEKFLDVAKTNRSQENLVFSRIVPFRDAVLKNTAKLMSAQEFISGGSSEFDRAYKDQLQNGMYVLEEVDLGSKGDTIGQNRVRLVGATADDTQKKIYKIRYDNGEPLRNEGSLSDYGLTVRQAVVDKVDWEPKFDERLDALKQIVAETQTQKITAEKEMYRKQAVIETGEANKAEEQAKLEKAQITETIAAETEVKKEKLFLEAASIKYDKALIEKKTRVTLADAKKYELDRADGLSEYEKYLIDANVDRADKVSKNLSGTSFPGVMMINNGGTAGSGVQANGGQMPFIYDLISADLAKSMMQPLEKKSK